MRKVNGVCYGPRKEPGRGSGKLANEWSPRQDFKSSNIAGHFGITVEGTSLDPIALHGQVVLVARKLDSRFDSIARGSLAVVETEDDRVGSVIKRVFPGERMWLLASPNPIEPRDPIAITKANIRAVWPVRGVIFEVSQVEMYETEAVDE